MNIKYALTLPRVQTYADWEYIKIYRSVNMHLAFPGSIWASFDQAINSSRWEFLTILPMALENVPRPRQENYVLLVSTLWLFGTVPVHSPKPVNDLNFLLVQTAILGSKCKLGFLLSMWDGSWYWGPWYCKKDLHCLQHLLKEYLSSHQQINLAEIVIFRYIVIVFVIVRLPLYSQTCSAA